MIHYYGSCRTLCWGSVTLLLLNISVTGIVRLLCVVQVSVCSGMETLTHCQLLSVVQIPPRGPWDPLHLSDNIPNDLGWSYAHRLQCELFEVTFYRILFFIRRFFLASSPTVLTTTWSPIWVKWKGPVWTKTSSVSLFTSPSPSPSWC